MIMELQAQNNTQKSSPELYGMLGSSMVMQRIFALITQAARTTYPVLITGATGTGKEMAARAIHQLSNRAKNPFVVINCGAVAENLVESELFGHEKGAFTGAIKQHIGKFEHANLGTVFLDEIGELPLTVQVKLLRVLQESTIERVGGRGTIKLDVRVIAATNVDLDEAVETGRFRDDLFFRINVFNVHLPRLKDRGEDILLIAGHFLEEERRRIGLSRLSFSPDAIVAMQAHSWPGNVRELKNRIRKAIAIKSWDLNGPGVIDAKNLGLFVKSDEKLMQEKAGILPLREARAMAEKESVLKALSLTGNNISKAAKLLEISRPTLHDLINKYGLRKK